MIPAPPRLTEKDLGERGWRAWGQANALWSLARGAISEGARQRYLDEWFDRCEIMLEEWRKRGCVLMSYPKSPDGPESL